MSKGLTALLIIIMYAVLFACQTLLALSVLYYRNSDCERIDSLVVGVYGIVDSNAHRQVELLRQGKTTHDHVISALATQRRAHLNITRPSC